MNCTLSVVMPVYNTEPLLLDRSVGSLLDQEYRDLELILVDDGSGEQTARRLDQLSADLHMPSLACRNPDDQPEQQQKRNRKHIRKELQQRIRL